jgi:hypothetical protein
MAETTLFHFDPSIPRRGAAAPAQEVRDQQTAIATSSAGTIEPSIPAQIIGDIKFATLNLSTQKHISITIDGTTHVVDVSSSTNPSETTPVDVVSNINSIFSPDEVAYVYSLDGEDNTAYVLLRSPSSGTASTITLDRGTPTDAVDLVFGVSGRGVTPPYTVTGDTLPVGYKWYKTTDGDDDQLQIHVNSPATAVGVRPIPGTGVDLTVLQNLRIRIVSSAGTFGPLDINISNGSNTSAAYIRDAINTDFISAGMTVGPCSIVTRGGTGSFIKIVSGEWNDPDSGILTQVVISEPTGSPPVHFLIDDAMPVVFGFADGELPREKMSRLPQIFTGASFTSTGMRGWTERSGPGSGPWGKTMDSRDEIPSQGVSDGEVRFARNSGIPWTYRDGFFGTAINRGWRRAIPGYEWPISYDKEWDRYKLKRTTSIFKSQPFHLQAGTWRKASDYITLPGADSYVVETVEARSNEWPDTTYPKHPDESGNPRNLWRDDAVSDDFSQIGGSVSPSFTLASSIFGGAWTQTTERIVSGGGQATSAASFAPLDQEDRCYHHHAAGHLYTDANLLGTGSATAFTTTITSPAIGVVGTIRPSSIHVVVVDITPVLGTYQVATVNAASGFGTGGGPAVNIIGSGFTGTNTVNVNTGAVTINLVSALTTSQRVIISFSISKSIIVSADFSVDTNIQGGNAVEFGLLYGFASDVNGTIDQDNGYLLRVNQNGSAGIFRRDGDSSETQIGTDFLVDPPISTTPRTLRVFLADSGSDAIHTVFWGGSNSIEDWIKRESVAEAASSETPFGGGAEVPHKHNPIQLAPTVESGSPHIGNTHCGFLVRARSSSGSFPSKSIYVTNFQIHGGKDISPVVVEPGLPPVSAIRTRDSIHSIRLATNGALDASGIITDCNHAMPFVLNATGDLASGASLDVPGRMISLDLSVITLLKNTNLVWNATTNPNGLIGLWTFDGGAGGEVDLTNTRLNGSNGNTINFASSALGGSVWHQPGSGEWIVTDLPPTAGAGTWRHFVFATATSYEQREPSTGAWPSGAASQTINLSGIPTFRNNGGVLEVNVIWRSSYGIKPQTGVIWGFAIRMGS